MLNEQKTIKITVIDDEKEMVSTIKEFLGGRNLSISCAYDGLTGLAVIKRDMPDVIILDITMPVKGGRDMLIELRKDDSIKDIPVIILTAQSEQHVRDYMLELGAYEYLTKPYDSYALLRQIRNVLDKKGCPADQIPE